MSIGVYEHPSLNVAIARLDAAAPSSAYAVWVLKAPYPSGHVLNSSNWTVTLTQIWLAWQELFGLGKTCYCPPEHQGIEMSQLDISTIPAIANAELPSGMSSNLMQYLGLNLWDWLLSGSVANVFAKSQGIALGQNKPLRLRLEIRDPDLIPLPWEILQPQPGKPALSLDRQILFSRTTSDVEPLPNLRTDKSIKILLVLGENGTGKRHLNLDEEAQTIVRSLQNTMPTGFNPPNRLNPAACQVTTLVQPTPEELLTALDVGSYNLFFYAGHGMPGPDGGRLLLNDRADLNGTELAQSLVRRGVKLAVFNACWGAQPYQQNQQTIPRSSLAEVLLHHGVPAVVAMRDPIADREALSFIQTFTQALAHRIPIDEAVSIARQQLLALYKYNQPAWTLPVLYMHPEFNGELVRPIAEAITEMPSSSQRMPLAYLREVGVQTNPNWRINGYMMKIGRLPTENDLILEQSWVSQRHAEIIYRPSIVADTENTGFYLRDSSSFGSYILADDGKWLHIHRQEVPLRSGVQIKFGNIDDCRILEFTIDN
jgi:hypothetical protein